MDVLTFKDDPVWNKTRKVRHQGTFNASPLVAAAGTIAVTKCADPAVQERCDQLASRLRAGVNAAFVKRGVPGFAWGDSSGFHIGVGTAIPNQRGEDLREPEGLTAEQLVGLAPNPLNTKLHLGLMLEGVELFHGGGFLSVKHTDTDVDRTVAAVDHVLGRMDDEGAFA
jgi:glutamate-1-semialdehyde 2,1-aminomutase